MGRKFTGSGSGSFRKFFRQRLSYFKRGRIILEYMCPSSKYTRNIYIWHQNHESYQSKSLTLIFFSENIKNPILVSEKVATESRHCLFAGEGALKFALKQGDLLTHCIKNFKFVYFLKIQFETEISVFVLCCQCRTNH